MLRQLMAMLTILSAIVLQLRPDAHPRLRIADPMQGGVLARSPTEIRLTFSEALLPQISSLR